MNNLKLVLEELQKNQNNLWIKYLKKGRIFARYGVIFSFDKEKIIVLVKSVRRNNKEVFSKLPITYEELLFIGNVTTGERVYLDDRFITVKDEN